VARAAYDSPMPALSDIRGTTMHRVRLHVERNGEIWVISTCRACGDEAKHLAADAILGPVTCARCGRAMDIKGATIDAVEDARELSSRGSSQNAD